jgi:hypothetical protein
MAKLGPSIQGPVPLRFAATSQKVPVTLVDATDLATLETGVSSPTIQASKIGGAYASLSDGTWAEVGNGEYTVTFNEIDTDTLGWIILRVVKSGTSAEAKVYIHVGVDPQLEHATAVRVRSLRRGQ